MPAFAESTFIKQPGNDSYWYIEMAPFTIGFIFVYSVTIIQASVMKPVGVIGPSMISCLYPFFCRYFWIPHWKHLVSGLSQTQLSLNNHTQICYRKYTCIVFLWLVMVGWPTYNVCLRKRWKSDIYTLSDSLLCSNNCCGCLCNGGFFRDSICRGRKKSRITSGLNLLLTISTANFICVAISQSFEFLFPKEITSLDPAEIYATSKIRSPKESDTSFESNWTKEYANSEVALLFLLLIDI